MQAGESSVVFPLDFTTHVWLDLGASSIAERFGKGLSAAETRSGLSARAESIVETIMMLSSVRGAVRKVIRCASLSWRGLTSKVLGRPPPLRAASVLLAIRPAEEAGDLVSAVLQKLVCGKYSMPPSYREPSNGTIHSAERVTTNALHQSSAMVRPSLEDFKPVSMTPMFRIACSGVTINNPGSFLLIALNRFSYIAG